MSHVGGRRALLHQGARGQGWTECFAIAWQQQQDVVWKVTLWRRGGQRRRRQQQQRGTTMMFEERIQTVATAMRHGCLERNSSLASHKHLERQVNMKPNTCLMWNNELWPFSQKFPRVVITIVLEYYQEGIRTRDSTKWTWTKHCHPSFFAAYRQTLCHVMNVTDKAPN